MSELPGRPNLDQLRRQARELLRAAANGEPAALARIRAVSARVSLSTAQLAVAREHGFASWPALHAEVERRLAELPAPATGAGRAGPRWSFGGAAAVETPAGTLHPGGLVAGPGRAALHASLVPIGEIRERLVLPPLPLTTSDRVARHETLMVLAEAIIGAVTLTDDQGAAYTLSVDDIQHYPQPGQDHEPVVLSLGIDPVPERARGWLELRGLDGSAAQLVPSPRPDARVSRLVPVPEGPAARELSELGLHLIGLTRLGADQEEMERYSSVALTRAAEIQQSAEPGTVGELPGQLARLCAFLTGRGPAGGLPREWSSVISAAKHADGARQHLDISAALPPVDDIVVRVDSLISESESWKVYLRAEPSWWTYSADRNRKWAVMSVHAEDNLGGLYLSEFDGSTGNGDHEELVLRFLPRLDPLARTLTLTFTHRAEQVSIELQLPGQ